jgi:transcriptional regulator with XRE-family HTH domain
MADSIPGRGVDISVGRQIRRLRDDADLTQAQLAAAAGVSLDLVRKLEQEVRYTASVASLHKIARALDVETGELLSKATPLPQPTERSGVVALRRVLTGVDDLLGAYGDTIDPITVEDARRTVTYAWGSYWAGRYEQLGETLPNALLGVKAARRDEPGLTDLAAQLYQVAGCTLVHLGHPDAANLALREGLQLAQVGSDPLQVAALRGSLAWLLLTQGRFLESHRLAVATAESIEPGKESETPRMSLWGSLVLSGATAAGRDGRGDVAGGLLAEATDIARHTGHRNDYETVFGPDQVIMQTVDVQVVTEQYGAALRTARNMPRDTSLPLAARARHLSDRALAQTRLGRDGAAVDTLLAMAQLAPAWMKYQAEPRMIVQELRGRERRARDPRLRALADRLNVVG